MVRLENLNQLSQFEFSIRETNVRVWTQRAFSQDLRRVDGIQVVNVTRGVVVVGDGLAERAARARNALLKVV